MAELNDTNVRHLLRRTEFVDRPARVQHLLSLGSIGAAVDDVLATRASPPSASLGNGDTWAQGLQLSHFWHDRMAHDSPRPMQEKMALFWHGHFCTDLGKVGSAPRMSEQIDLFRREGLTNVRSLAKKVSTQVAMIRYLDNNLNFASSPNQNFARELMELFLLGVGNYNEANVEAAAAAWTGHSDNWPGDGYLWRANEHDGRSKRFLGQTINAGGDAKQHGPQTIDVMLGSGRVPADANVVEHRNRPTRWVASKFLTTKLWAHFAKQDISPGTLGKLSRVLRDNNFAIKPWVRAMLIDDAFYSTSVRQGLVRSPTDWLVSILHASGLRSADVDLLWITPAMGQQLLYPPNVSGWGTNGYFVNASAMGARASVAQHLSWRAGREYWRADGNGYIELRNGRITLDEIAGVVNGVPKTSAADVVDKMLRLMDLQLRDASRREIVSYVERAHVWDRDMALVLILLAPDLHIA